MDYSYDAGALYCWNEFIPKLRENIEIASWQGWPVLQVPFQVRPDVSKNDEDAWLRGFAGALESWTRYHGFRTSGGFVPQMFRILYEAPEEPLAPIPVQTFTVYLR